MSRPAKNPEIVGYNEEGKPRVRVSSDYVLGQNPYRKLETMPGQALFDPLRSAQQDVARGRDRALKSARDSEKNNESVRGGLDRKANAVVGADLRPTPNPDTTWLGLTGTAAIDFQIDYQQAASSVFAEWGDDIRCLCDASRHYNFGGLMWQGFRSMAGPDAEVSGIIRYDEERASRYNHKWATFVEMIDTDRISNPDGVEDRDPAPGGEGLVHGRYIDEWSAMTALSIERRHPSESSRTDPRRTWVRVPRETEIGRPMAFHWFFKRRPGMQRALTSLVAVLSTVGHLGTLDTARLKSAVSNAMMSTYVKSTMAPETVAAHLAPNEEFDGVSEFDFKVDAYSKMNLSFGNNRIPVLGPNDEIKMESLDKAAVDYDAFRNAFLRELASALGISYEQLSLDFSKSSYSSTRSSILEAWRQVTLERRFYTAHVASLIYDAVIEEAFAMEILKVPNGAPDFLAARAAYTRVKWTGPGMGWVDPLKEIDAAKGRVGLIVSTLEKENAEQGNRWDETLRQAAVEKRMAEREGLMIDTGATAAKLAQAEATDADSTNADTTNGDNEDA